MKILLTGASGFLGKEIEKYFNLNKHNYVTLGRSMSNKIICDLSIETPQLKGFEIDTVIHVAGKAHSVPKTEKEIEDFYTINVGGTKKLIDSLKEKLPNTFIFISTIAVYGLEEGDSIDESYPLLGDSPYAKSKILAEKEVVEFGKEYNVNTVILRLPLITGPHPIGNLGSMIKAIKLGYYFRIGDGDAKRSLVAASDIGSLLIKLKNKNGVFNVADSSYPTIKEIDTHIANTYNKKIKVMPKKVMAFLSKIGDSIPLMPLNTLKFQKLTNSLTFSNAKILEETDWVPSHSLKDLK